MNNLGAGTFFSGILQNGDVYVGDLNTSTNSQNSGGSLITTGTRNYRVWNANGGWSGNSLWQESYGITKYSPSAMMDLTTLGLSHPVYEELQSLYESCGSLVDMTLEANAIDPTGGTSYSFTQFVNGGFTVFDGGIPYWRAAAGVSIFLLFEDFNNGYDLIAEGQGGSAYMGKRFNQNEADYGYWKSDGIVKTDPLTFPLEHVEDEDQFGVAAVWMNENGFAAGKEAKEFSISSSTYSDVKWIQSSGGNAKELSSSMGEINGLTKNAVGNGEGPYFRTNTGLVAYNGGSLVYKQIPTFLASVYPGTPRTISNSLVMPGGSSIWRNGRQWTMQELCGNSEIWSDVSAQLVSPETNLLAGTAMNVESGTYHAVLLLPVDLDVIHPATGEMNENREQSEGGYIAIYRDEETPVTKLKLHKLAGLQSATFKVVFTSDKINLWQDENKTQAVISEQTVFSADVDTELYIEGVEKSASARDVEIGMKVKIGSTESSAVTVKATVVHSEFLFVIRGFIPHKWTEGELPFPVHSWPFISTCIGGNRQIFSLISYEDEAEFKLAQEVIITPYEDIHNSVDISQNRREKITLVSKYYNRNEDLPESDRHLRFGEVLIGQPNWEYPTKLPTSNYSEDKRFKDSSTVRKARLKASLSGEAGGPGWVWGGLIANIDYAITIHVEAAVNGENRTYIEAKTNLYPAYEVVVENTDSTGFIPVFQSTPNVNIVPGPVSLNTSIEINSAYVEIP